jgi:hypothetical protein
VISLKGEINLNIKRDSPFILTPQRKLLIHAALDSMIMANTTPFVPMDTGVLASSPIRVENKIPGVIKYKTPYAKRQYYGVNFSFRRVPHPLATHHWIEAGKLQWIDQWKKMVGAMITGAVDPRYVKKAHDSVTSSIKIRKSRR